MEKHLLRSSHYYPNDRSLRVQDETDEENDMRYGVLANQNVHLREAVNRLSRQVQNMTQLLDDVIRSLKQEVSQ